MSGDSMARPHAFRAVNPRLFNDRDLKLGTFSPIPPAAAPSSTLKGSCMPTDHRRSTWHKRPTPWSSRLWCRWGAGSASAA